MSELSDELKAEASEILTEYGESVAFVREVKGSYNISTSITPIDSTTNYSGFGVASDYSAFEKTLETVEATDVELTVEVTTTVPEVGDTATVSSVTYRVHNVSQAVVNGSPVVYTLQLRTI